MNYEQRYKEALDNAKVVYKTIRKDLKPVMEQIFPELEEPEDERIRKAIYNALKYLETVQSWDFLDIDISDAYAWLEKQGEQKSNWSEEDEKKRTLLIRILEVNHPNGYFKVNPANTSNMEAIYTEELVSWLKSLRPQNKWTPSKKQSEQKVAVIN